MAESEKKYRSVCDEPAYIPEEFSFSASELSSVLQRSHEQINEKIKHKNCRILQFGVVVIGCGMLANFWAWYQHSSEPGHHISFSNSVSNEKRIDKVEREIDKIDRVMDKAEHNEQNVQTIMLDLKQIKEQLETR